MTSALLGVYELIVGFNQLVRAGSTSPPAWFIVSKQCIHLSSGLVRLISLLFQGASSAGHGEGAWTARPEVRPGGRGAGAADSAGRWSPG